MTSSSQGTSSSASSPKSSQDSPPTELFRTGRLTALLSVLSEEELRELLEQTEALEKELSLHGPQNDDQLHAWIKQNVGINIPRNPVCEGHVAPFTFVSDAYFERHGAAVVMANRGGSKTFSVALLHLLNSKFKPGTESATVGAIEQQALRCYMHVQKLLVKEGRVNNPEENKDIASSIMRETRWKNGSRLEVLPGTMSAVNGPHPQKVHADEVELMDPDVYQESRNMSLSSNGIRAQDWITSTRKGPYGQMQQILNEITEARGAGVPPPYDLYVWCIFEAAARVPNCQVANPDIPMPCNCHEIVKGRWENGGLRTFKDVCQGRLARSDGWIPLEDLHKTFRLDSQPVWEAQQECLKPSTEGLVIPQFAIERHGIRGWEPNPEIGPIFMSVDFGGTNPHAVEWFQMVQYECDTKGYQGAPRRIPEGAMVAFDEIYRAEIGNNKLAKLIVEREIYWKARMGPKWRVTRRFGDPQAKAARLDFARHSPPLPISFAVTREVKEHVKLLVNLVGDDLFYVDTDRCKMFCEEVALWHYPKKKPEMTDDPEVPVDDFDHAMSAWRYAAANIWHLKRRSQRKTVRPGSTGVIQTTAENLRRGQQLPTTTGPRRYGAGRSGRMGRERFQP